MASHCVAMLVQERSSDFEPKDDFLGEVSSGGGDQELLKTLRASKVIQPTTMDPAAVTQEAEVAYTLEPNNEFYKSNYEDLYRVAAVNKGLHLCPLPFVSPFPPFHLRRAIFAPAI